jgi:hypothetical protein
VVVFFRSRAWFGFEKLRTVGHHHRHYHCPHTSSFCGDGIWVVVREIIIRMFTGLVLFHGLSAAKRISSLLKLGEILV